VTFYAPGTRLLGLTEHGASSCQDGRASGMSRRCLACWLLLIAIASSNCTGTQGNGPAAKAQTSLTPLPSSVAESPLLPASPSRARLRGVKVRLVKLVAMKDPIALAWRPPDTTIYVGQRKGIVWAIRDGKLERNRVLDISSEVDSEGEGGLLGMTFSPDGSWLFVSYTDHHNRVRLEAWPVEEGQVVPHVTRNILTIPQPGPIHHGGDIHFGPAGNMWISTGDAEPESASETATTSQSRNTLLGKLLRIIPTPESRRPYRIPPGNPFVGHARRRPEIFAYGFRNPWRFSFDRATGDLWIGDVGRYRMEEIDFLASGKGAGANFGWNGLEGTLRLARSRAAHSVLPLYEYPHSNGRCAVIGGYVYRGPSISALDGAYVYTDWCRGELRALVQRDGRFALERSLHARLSGIASFAEDPYGELYALSLFRGVFRLEGA
jgi:glucose/arabinose dehydrogenase